MGAHPNKPGNSSEPAEPEGRTLAFNVSVLVGAGIGQKGLSLLNSILIARALGPGAYGVLAAAVALSATLASLGDFGLLPRAVYAVSHHRASAGPTLVQGLCVKLAAAPLVYLAIVGVASISRVPSAVISVIWVVAIASLLESGLFYTFFIFRSHEQLQYEALVTLLYQALLALTAVAAYVLHLPLLGIARAYVLAASVCMLASWLAIRRYFPTVRSSVSLTGAWSQLRLSLPFGLYAAVNAALYRTDIVVLTILATPAAAGIYAASLTGPLAYIFLPQAFAQAIAARLVRGYLKLESGFEGAVAQLLRTYLVWAGAAAIVNYIAATTVLRIAFGHGYFGQSATLMQIFSIGLFPFFASYGLLSALIATKHVYFATACLVLAIGGGLMADVVLLHTLGAVGAAVAFVVEHIILSASLLAGYVRLVGPLPLVKWGVQASAITAIAVAALRILPTSSVALAIPVPLALYLVLIWFFFLSVDERQSFKALAVPRGRE